MKKYIYIFLFIMGGAYTSSAQQEFLITHYMFNGLALNPAYAGVHEGISASFLYRNQWVGIPGAPNTQVASIHGPLKDRPASLGALLYRDQLGLSTEYGGYFSYSYRLPITEKLKLSLGMQLNTHNFAIEWSRARNDLFDVRDTDINGDVSEFKFNFGAGALLHTDRLFVGLSVPQMLNRKLDVDDPDGSFARLVRHYYLLGGYAFNVNSQLVLKPNVLFRAVGNAPAQVDLNLNALVNSFLWVGVSYRSFDSIDGIIGFQLTPQFLVSYASDFSLTEINRQSHEILLNYVFELPTKKILTPRYF